MATHSSILACRIPTDRAAGGPNVESCLRDTTERLSTAQPVNNVVIVPSEQQGDSEDTRIFKWAKQFQNPKYY